MSNYYTASCNNIYVYNGRQKATILLSNYTQVNINTYTQHFILSLAQCAYTIYKHNICFAYQWYIIDVSLLSITGKREDGDLGLNSI